MTLALAMAAAARSASHLATTVAARRRGLGPHGHRRAPAVQGASVRALRHRPAPRSTAPRHRHRARPLGSVGRRRLARPASLTVRLDEGDRAGRAAAFPLGFVCQPLRPPRGNDADVPQLVGTGFAGLGSSGTGSGISGLKGRPPTPRLTRGGDATAARTEVRSLRDCLVDGDACQFRRRRMDSRVRLSA